MQFITNINDDNEMQIVNSDNGIQKLKHTFPENNSFSNIKKLISFVQRLETRIQFRVQSTFEE